MSTSTDKKVLLCMLPFPESPELKKAIKYLESKYTDMEVIYKHIVIDPKKNLFHENDIPDELFAKATILCTLSALPSSASLVPNLKFIHFFSAGVNHIIKHPIYTDSDITLTTSSGIHGPMISEWVVMQILTHSHKAKTLLAWQREHKWGSHQELGSNTLKDSVGMRIGILGYGSIGRQAGRVCKAMGMDVIAFTASPRTTPESKRDNGYVVPGTGDVDGSIPSAWFSGLDKPALHEFLAQALDVLLVAVPLTDATAHMLGAAEFAILGRQRGGGGGGALVCNIARGSIIVQADLAAALRRPVAEGGLRGAALDVTDPEPLGEESELWDLENVTITPHCSGLSAAYADRSLQILGRNIAHMYAGEKLINVVRRERGY